MTRKLSLPLFNLGQGVAAHPRQPTVDAVRSSLGGRASTEPMAGEVVTLTTPSGAAVQGVVLFAREDEVDVWVEQGSSPRPALNERLRLLPGPPARTGTVRRARRADIAPPCTPASKELNALASDARVFGRLLEGQRIRFRTEDGLRDGTLVEKCRFGALVQRDDGTLVGVGFRRIWPAQLDGGDRN